MAALRFLSILVGVLAVALVTVEKLLPDQERPQLGLSDLPSHLQTWRQRGQLYSVDGHKMFAFVEGNGPETVILVHGFPCSSFDFHRVLDELLDKGLRVVLFDHVGFGFSDKPDDESTVYSMADQADNALLLWRFLGIKRAHIVAHDMGDSVVTEILSRRQKNLLPDYFNDFFQSVTFTNGGMRYKHINMRLSQRALITPGLKDWLAALKRKIPYEWERAMFTQQLRSIWSPSYSNVARREQDIEDMLSLLRFKDGDRILHKTMSYLVDRARFEPRWMRSLAASADLPFLAFWGDSDAVAPMDIPKSLASEVFVQADPRRPSAKLTGKLLKGVGHFGMLEEPEKWAATVAAFIKENSQ